MPRIWVAPRSEFRSRPKRTGTRAFFFGDPHPKHKARTPYADSLRGNIHPGRIQPLKGHSTSRRFFIESGRLLERSEFLAWFTLIVRNLDMLKKLNAHLKNVLFISGTEDFTFLRKLVKALRSRSDLQLTLLGRCGHVCSLQRPREFNSLTQNYLDRILPPPTENPHCKETHNYG